MKNNNQKGQILLITIMLLAAAVTVVMTIAFSSTTETQISKLEEDSQKALSAAEAALEAAIQKKANVALDTLPAFMGSNITGGADIVEVGGNEFITPLLQRDEQYTFYLADYNSLVTPPIAYWTGSLVIYFQSEAVGGCPTLELTFVDSANAITKSIIDSCGVVTDPNNLNINTATGAVVKGVNFASKTSSAIAVNGNMKLVFIRVLNASTRLGFTGTGLKAQGRVITSEAKTQSGATKKIELFQSYPQIPADFFVTGF